MIRKNFQKDPLNLINKVIVFNVNMCDYDCSLDECDEHGWAFDFPIGFKARVLKYYYIDEEVIQFDLDFEEFLDENRELWQPNWTDKIDGQLVKNLTWEQCPTFWNGLNTPFHHHGEIFNLPFDPIDE